MGGGKGGSTQQPSGQTVTTTNQEPWSAQQPYLQNAFNQAQNLLNNPPAYYPGQTIAQPDPLQYQGINQTLNAIGQIQPYATQALINNNNIGSGAYGGWNNPASSQLDLLSKSNFITPSQQYLHSLIAGGNPGQGSPGQGTLQDYASGQYLNVGNPNSGALAQSVLAQVVPSIQKQFIDGGNLSSPQAAYATSQGATAALAPLAYQNYLQQQQLQTGAAGQLAQNYLAGAGLQTGAASTLGNLGLGEQGAQAGAANNLGSLWNQGVQQQNAATALAPGAQQSFLAGPQATYGLGQTLQGLNQSNINSDIQRWNYYQTLPYQQLNQFIGQISGNYGGTGQTLNPYYTNTGANALSGGLGGAFLGSALGGAFPETIGAGLGGGLGGGAGLLLGLLSDRRLKTDIERVGTLHNGLPVYSFRYLGDPVTHIGLMADEVYAEHPDAVGVNADGYLMVDYGRAVQ